DDKDAQRFLAFLTDDAEFRFANASPALGSKAITQLLDGFFASIHALHHDLLNTWTVADHVLCQGTVTYTRIDGSMLCVPFVDVFTMRGKLISNFLIYVDASQLYAANS
ncbi:MAG: nuclear transport factor 2 family protein, partial [Betaproteobacteria bacterium]